MDLTKHLSKLTNYPPTDIEFENLSYFVRERSFRPGSKQILRSVNGKFLSGQLTAILGSSGAGKTTLLNILAGYVSNGVRGTIKVNNAPRNMNIFRKISAYIMQDDLLQPLLTVREIMMVAANLKLSPTVSQEDKENIVIEVIQLIGLTSSLNTRTDNLSGGQRKRLSVALELVNNPPIIFLDEPTTGLDNVSMKTSIEILKLLTSQGRTVVCTIHQPSDTVFQLFDQVYFMESGNCVYSGSVPDVVPFLSSAGLPCPTTYSPADYIVEITYQHPENVEKLVSKLNELHYERRVGRSVPDYNSVYAETTEEYVQHALKFPTNFWTQFCILVHRNLLQARRNTTSLKVQLIHHVLSAMSLGIIFFAIGNDASMVLANFKFCICILVFFVFTYISPPVLLYPTEFKIIRREYYNRWYSLKAYYLALTITPLPTLIIFGTTFSVISYLMTNQPMNLERFFLFTIVGIFMGINAYGYGLAVGSFLNTKNAIFISAITVAPLTALSLYGMGYGRSINPIMKVIMHFSFIRYGIVAMSNALFSDRDSFECFDELYCHYTDPDLFLKDLGMYGSSYSLQVIGIVAFTILHRYIAYLIIKFRLTREHTNVFLNYITNILKQIR